MDIPNGELSVKDIENMGSMSVDQELKWHLYCLRELRWKMQWHINELKLLCKQHELSVTIDE